MFASLQYDLALTPLVLHETEFPGPRPSHPLMADYPRHACGGPSLEPLSLQVALAITVSLPCLLGSVQETQSLAALQGSSGRSGYANVMNSNITFVQYC